MYLTESNGGRDFCEHDPIQTPESIVCRNCGLVLDRIYEDTKSYRKNEKFGGFIIQNYASSPSFEIGCRTGFNPYDSETNRGKFYHLQKYNQHDPKKNRELRIVKIYLPQIQIIIEKYGFTKSVKSQVLKLFTKVYKKGLLTGRVATVFIYAIFHIICRILNQSHFVSVVNKEGKVEKYISPFFDLKVIAKLEEIPENQLNQAYFRIRIALNMFIPQPAVKTRVDDIRRGLEAQDVDCTGFQQKVMNYIKVMEFIYRDCVKDRSRDTKWVVGPFFYIFQKELFPQNISQSYIAKALNTSEVTIRRWIKRIQAILDEKGIRYE